MSVTVSLKHDTIYRFDRKVALGPHVVRLRPAPHCRARIEQYALRVAPETHLLHWRQDPCGNHEARVVFQQPADLISFEVELTAELEPYNPFDFLIDPYAEQAPFEYEPDLRRELTANLGQADQSASFLAYADQVTPAASGSVELLTTLTQQVCEDIRYQLRHDHGIQAPGETIDLKQGSCRDTAWLLVHLLRNVGIAARFVSGYLVQLKPDDPVAEPDGPEEDSAELHAWCEAYLPGAGWVGLDPTSGMLAAEGHLPLSAGSEPSAAAPIQGSGAPCEAVLEHSVTLRRELVGSTSDSATK